MRFIAFLLSVLFSALLASSTAFACEGLKEAEAVAVQYMTDFFHSNLTNAAYSLHPETLQRLKETFFSGLSTISKEEVINDEFARALGLPESYESLRNGDGRDLFVKILEYDRSKDKEAWFEMKKTTVTAINSGCLSNDEAYVALKITSPMRRGFMNQNASLTLKKYGIRWMVLSDNEEPLM